jgi:hypothetical protein
MASLFNDDPTGDDPDKEPVNPNPDALVTFGNVKITAKQRKSAIPELLNNLLGAIDAIARRAQNGPISREEAYLVKTVLNSAIFNHPDAVGVMIQRLGLSGVLALKGNKKGIHLDDPTKMTPMKMVNPGQ